MIKMRNKCSEIKEENNSQMTRTEEIPKGEIDNVQK